MGLQDREWMQRTGPSRSTQTRFHKQHQPRKAFFSHFVVLVLGIVIGMVAADLHWLDMLRQQLPL